MKKFLLALAIIGVMLGGFSACSTTNGNGVKSLEEMTDLEYNKWKMYIQLGVKIGANHLLQDKKVTAEQLNVVAGIIDGIKGEPVAGGAKSLIIPALHEAGFNNDEIEFILLIAEQELLARGALDWLNPQTNILELSPRTQEILTVIADALRTADTVTTDEKTQSQNMKADFCRSSQ